MAITPSDVEEIYPDEVTQAAIDASDQIVSNVLSNCDYTDKEKDRIATWLAAHFQSSIDDDFGVTSIRQGERSKSKGAVFGKGLEATRYGQMAMSLDTCGKLANLGKQVATMEVL